MNGKRYIGQTTNYRKRSSDYKCAERRNLTHPIYNAIINEGSDNFVMRVEKICDPKHLTKMETKFIKLYDTTDPSKGYNVAKSNRNNTSKSRRNKSLGHCGIKESNDTKRKKSNMILAIKDHDLIVCDSAKLFGDYIHKTKDLIKNGLRQPTSINGYLLYYDDYCKRQEIRLIVNNRKKIRNKKYIEILDILDEVEIEGVETIYSLFDVYKLSYDNEIRNGELTLEKLE